MQIKAIIFDWGRTLFDSETKKEFFDSEEVLEFCKNKGLRLAVASLVSASSNANLEERKNQIATSVLRKFFEFTMVTDVDKDLIFDEIVNKLDLPRDEILIVDDRIIRGIRYGNKNGHPTVWFQNDKFADELPNKDTKEPTYMIHSLLELKEIL